MTIEGSSGCGSMYGVVDSMHQMTQALEALLEHLPNDFVWPTNVNVSPFSMYVEWGRDNSKERTDADSVWFIASAQGVKMNYSGRPNWPDCGASDFDAAEGAQWLKELTRNWEWSAENNTATGHTTSTLGRRPR